MGHFSVEIMPLQGQLSVEINRQVYDGEHEAIVDKDLWDQVQMHLKAKAPPRRRLTNDPQRALLRGLLSDPEGRQIVATYATKGCRRYVYYETRKDLARPHDPPSTRFRQGDLDQHIISHVTGLLEDEHALRRMANLAEAEQLRHMFARALKLCASLGQPTEVASALRSLIALIQVRKDHLELAIKPKALGIEDQPCWTWSIPRPARKPFREARLRIDATHSGNQPDPQLTRLLADALDVQKLVLTSPELSLNQLAGSIGRCRKRMARLFRVSWLSPLIVEAIVEGSQPKALTRNRLLEADLPVDWAEQAALLGFAV